MQSNDNAAIKNEAICRKELDRIPNGNFLADGYEACNNMVFFRIQGMTRFWENQPTGGVSGLMADVLSSTVRHGIPFAFAICGDETGIAIYLGTLKLLRDSLISTCQALYPGLEVENCLDNPIKDGGCRWGGLFTGIPTDKNKREEKGFQIENICRGMQGKQFVYLILASGISNHAVSFGHERILQEMENEFAYLNQTVSGGGQGNISIQKQNFAVKNYLENLEVLEKAIKIGTARGMWRVNGYYASADQSVAKQLGNIIKASFSGEESQPEPFRVIDYHGIQDVIPNLYMMADLIENPYIHPLGAWQHNGIEKAIQLFIYKYQTILNSDQLAALCQLPKTEFPGYYLDEFVEFDVSNRNRMALENEMEIGEICTAGRNPESGMSNRYAIEKNDLTRHALIIGITGGGKTNTAKSLLGELWNPKDQSPRIPFMVIESAKREYWELYNHEGFEDLLVFTLGDEAAQTAVKYRINPFETNPQISLQTHIDYLLATFKAAFDLYPPMPYILEKAVYEVYRDRGWDIVENQNRYGLTEYPTLFDLYHKIDVVVDNMGYHQEIQSNVKAALQARIYSLMIGGKGAMLNTPKSIPIETLLSRPVVLELEDLGDDETKSFVTGILLVQLYEYRKSQMTKGSKRLSHVLMVEEAHRLLKNVSETGEGGNTRAKSVEFFCNMLAEIRTYGQGIMIADQIPTKLATDTIKNTNLKIVHRTVALEDRETIGRAMNMSPSQIDYLSSLKRGVAAIYAEGDNRPKCVRMPLVEARSDHSRSDVIHAVRNQLANLSSDHNQLVTHHGGCAFCEQRCRHFEKVKAFVDTEISVRMVHEKLEARQYAPGSLEALMNSELMQALQIENTFEKRCALGYVLGNHPEMKMGQQQAVMADYLHYINSELRGENYVGSNY